MQRRMSKTCSIGLLRDALSRGARSARVVRLSRVVLLRYIRTFSACGFVILQFRLAGDQRSVHSPKLYSGKIKAMSWRMALEI